MTIQQITTNFSGQEGVNPRLIRIVCNDNYAAITALNYLNNSVIKGGNQFYPTDFVAVAYSGGFGWFNLSITSSGITLVPTAAPGSATGSLVNGDFAVFNGTTGLIKDSGYSPSNAAKTKVVMANAATVVKNVAVFSDLNGTIQDGQYRLIAGVTQSWGGGSTSNAFSVTGLTVNCVGSCNIVTSTNNVSIAKVGVSTNTLTVTFTADPGATTSLSYIYSTGPLT